MKVVEIAMAATVIAALPSCAAQTDDAPTGYALCGRTGVFRTNAGILRICSPITEAVVDDVAEALRPEDREVILTSDGGMQIYAIRLGELLRSRDVTVRVRQFCLSACSTYVMGLSNRVIVDPYTVVAFHHTASFALDAVAARLRLAENSSVRRTAQAERLAFRAAGLDDHMLDRIAMSVEPTCAASRQINGRPEIVINYRWQWFIPNEAAAREIFGNRLSGNWIDDEEMAKTIFRRSLDQPDATIRFGPLAEGEQNPEIVGPALPSCGL